MHILTTLGKNSYKYVKYAWEGQVYESDFFIEALVNWLNPSMVHVMLTPDVRENDNWNILQTRLHDKTQIHPLDIPNGANENELWNLFDTIVQLSSKNPNEDMAIDITHGFRSLPILMIIVAVFLRSAKIMNLSHIFYGAFDAKDEKTGIVPVFDLTPFLELLDWSAAAERFNDTGDSTKIAGLLRQKQNALHHAPSLSNKNKPVNLSKLGNTMERISCALALNQAGEVLAEANILLNKLDIAKDEIRFAPPFKAIFESIKRSYLPLPIPENPEARDTLQGQWRLILWYRKRVLWSSMITLAREWIVSMALYGNKMELYDPKSRDSIEKALNLEYRKRVVKEPESIDKIDVTNDCSIELSELMINAWCKVVDLRNRISHCGMRKDAIKSDKLQSNIEKTVENLKALAMENGMEG